jgi:hypothetical protein
MVTADLVVLLDYLNFREFTVPCLSCPVSRKLIMRFDNCKYIIHFKNEDLKILLMHGFKSK